MIWRLRRSNPVPHRHDLMWVSPEGWEACLEMQPRLRQLPSVRSWITAGRPVIRRRLMPGDNPKCCPAAITTPLAEGRMRIGLEVTADAIVHVEKPPALVTVQKTLPLTWQATLERIVATGHRHGLTPRVFGSAMWQVVTGHPYLTDRSDIDLLWHVPDARLAESAALCLSLQKIGQDAPVRLDGEIMRDDGLSMNWREFDISRSDRDILVKSDTGANLMSQKDFVGQRRTP